MKWISNTYNPNADDWGDYIIRKQGETKEAAIKRMEVWLKDKVIGDPQTPPGSDIRTAELKKNEPCWRLQHKILKK